MFTGCSSSLIAKYPLDYATLAIGYRKGRAPSTRPESRLTGPVLPRRPVQVQSERPPIAPACREFAQAQPVPRRTRPNRLLAELVALARTRPGRPPRFR